MSRSRPYTLLDVFTDTPLAGNPLAVVHDADDLDDETMHRFARETRLSETTFVQAPIAPGADYRNRIWMMKGEIPMAGHPSLGTAVAVARARGERRARYTQETPAGLQPVEVELDGDVARASMLQEPARFGPQLDPDTALRAIGLRPEDSSPDLPPQVVSTGAPQVLLLLRGAEALGRVRPDWQAIPALLAPHEAVVLYAAWWDAGTQRVRARSFPSSTESGEDPATGAAAGPLCAYLKERTGTARVEIDQGVEMGRPSRLVAELEGDRVKVSGEVVVVVDGTLRL